MANKTAILKTIRMLAALYPSYAAKRTDRDWIDLADAWAVLLADVPDDLLQVAAIDQASRTDDHGRSFFPDAAQVRQAARRIHAAAMNVPDAGAAWSEVMMMIRRGCRTDHGGWYTDREPTRDDWSTPMIQDAIDAIGGWTAIRTSSNMPADRARFMDIYAARLDRWQDREYSHPAVRAAVEAIRIAGGDLSRVRLADPLILIGETTP